MSVTDELIDNARSYAAAFDKGALPLPPARWSDGSVKSETVAELNDLWRISTILSADHFQLLTVQRLDLGVFLLTR